MGPGVGSFSCSANDSKSGSCWSPGDRQSQKWVEQWGEGHSKAAGSGQQRPSSCSQGLIVYQELENSIHIGDRFQDTFKNSVSQKNQICIPSVGLGKPDVTSRLSGHVRLLLRFCDFSVELTTMQELILNNENCQKNIKRSLLSLLQEVPPLGSRYSVF